MDHIYDLLAAGTLSVSFKAFFFFFFYDLNEKEMTKIDAIVNEKMLNFKNTKNASSVRNTLIWLELDNFSKDLIKDFQGQSYLQELNDLKNAYVEFYQLYLDEIVNQQPGLNQVADVVAKNDAYILQIARLRMIVDPQIQLSQNVHKQTKILYMKVKGYWLTDNGIKERKFFKSLGRFDSYKGGIKDENALLDGRNKIREAMLSEYSALYKK